MLKQINNIKVGKIQTGNGGPAKPVRGASIFAEPYANVFLLAKKKSGKTTLLTKILKKCAGPHTKLVFMVSTIDKDDIYKHIVEYFEKKGNEVKTYTTVNEGKGKNRISHIEEELGLLAPDEDEEEDEDTPDACPFINFGESCQSKEDKPAKKKKREDTFLSPEIIFILDDQGTLLRNQDVSNLLKKNRHYKSKVLISSQYLHDLRPEAISQLDYFIVFGKQPEDKLKRMWRTLDLALTYDEFKERYHQATDERFSFLYIDLLNEKYRIKLDREFID